MQRGVKHISKKILCISSFCSILFLYLLPIDASSTVDEHPSSASGSHPPADGEIEKSWPTWDPNGYILFCLCMGRVGNQIEHLLGGMAFAKSINRTLILPPFRTYRNVPFNEWFQFEPMKDFHRVILAEDFMVTLADQHWPPGNRLGFCYGWKEDEKIDCKMKEGNPFGPFWDGLNVDFDGNIFYQLSYSHEIHRWNEMYPPSQYPVIAMKGAPASFPMDPDNWELQKYLVFSDEIEREADKYINEHFPNKPFIGIHLRNGLDWEKACDRIDGMSNYMASPQCLHGTGKVVTKNMCLPSKKEVLRIAKNLVVTHRIKVIFVATDKNPMIEELKSHLSNQKVEVYHADPWLPLVDWSILLRSEHFVGNCVSSFTSFVKRARDVRKKPSLFWGFS